MFSNLKFPKCSLNGISRCRNFSTDKWKSVVGLEVHAQIQSTSKLFSGSPTEFTNPVNRNVSLFDAATPGTLPVLNKRCVEAAVLTALALNCRVNPISTFDRKHYFYADLPAGYQITQQRSPIACNGFIDFHVYAPGVHKHSYAARSCIKQIQLEQDSGKSLHDETRSLVDLNRAGVPLMELVFEPDLCNGEEAAALVKELVNVFECLQTCSCKMEEGALRVDANVSVHKKGQPLGIRTEVKNIGSIRAVAAAINYEIQRQIALLEVGENVVNETRSWNSDSRVTVSMRDKEEKQDYRYMPEPNLPPLYIAMGPTTWGCVNAEHIKKLIPQLPHEIRKHLKEECNLTTEQAIILVNELKLLRAFTSISLNKKLNATLIANLLINDFLSLVNKEKMDLDGITINPSFFGDIVELLQNEMVSHKSVQFLMGEMLKSTSKTVKEVTENCASSKFNKTLFRL
uniref:Glutamyl-tRNA(Gln) amidotransferase subunit B, mitochondrial n=3 Tax=Photinus pyralis TaxID=7054 RepID=A0A1Y1KYJ0_PHOPY